MPHGGELALAQSVAYDDLVFLQDLAQPVAALGVHRRAVELGGGGGRVAGNFVEPKVQDVGGRFGFRGRQDYHALCDRIAIATIEVVDDAGVKGVPVGHDLEAVVQDLAPIYQEPEHALRIGPGGVHEVEVYVNPINFRGDRRHRAEADNREAIGGVRGGLGRQEPVIVMLNLGSYRKNIEQEGCCKV